VLVLNVDTPIHTFSPDSNNRLHIEPSLFCRFQEVSHTLTTKKLITLLCSSTLQVDIGAAVFYEVLRSLILLNRHDPYMAYC
jgi:hypothetical protein